MSTDRAPEVDALRELAFVVDEFAAENEAENRRARRLNQLLDQESATLSGVLVSLSEQRARVVVRLTDGWECSGVIAAVGTDVVVVGGDDGQRNIIRISSIASTSVERTSPCASGSAGDRPGQLDATFEDFVRDMHALETPVTVLSSSATPSTTSPGASTRSAAQSGVLQWVGVDVAYLARPRLGTSAPTGNYLALNAIRVVMTR
jgi:hypothetical protein